MRLTAYIALLASLLFVTTPLARAEVPAVGADQAFAEFEAAQASEPPADLNQEDRAAILRWSDAKAQKLAKQGLEIYAAYPADPRRWGVVQFITQFMPPRFVKEIGPDFATAGMKAVTTDGQAAAAWAAKSAELSAAMAAATDVPPGVRESTDWADFAKDFRATSQAKAQGKPYDYGPLKARFDAHVARYPGLGPELVRRAQDYLGALAYADAEAAQAVWAHLATDCPVATLKQFAQQKLRAAEVLAKPVEMKFTAADGREVDVAKLRGKVVLIDFWATWCGPCKAEIPNVAANYKKYHEKGFEVVGISLENARLAPKDTAEQAAVKLAKAKQVLLDFTAANDMPWPQYFDGKWWKNELSSKYDIQGIPAMFLLDQSGRVVTTTARGEKLEAEVKRLLGL